MKGTKKKIKRNGKDYSEREAPCPICAKKCKWEIDCTDNPDADDYASVGMHCGNHTDSDGEAYTINFKATE